MNKNIIMTLTIGLLAIAIVFAAVFAFYLYKKSQPFIIPIRDTDASHRPANINPIVEGWKTYVSYNLRSFSFNYPPEWEIVPSPDADKTTEIFSRFDKKIVISNPQKTMTLIVEGDRYSADGAISQASHLENYVLIKEAKASDLIKVRYGGGADNLKFYKNQVKEDQQIIVEFNQQRMFFTYKTADAATAEDIILKIAASIYEPGAIQ